MVAPQIFLSAKSRLAPESLAFRLANTANVLCYVTRGHSLTKALSFLFSDETLDAPTRGAIQDMAYHTLRNLGLARFLVRQLTRKYPTSPLLLSLLHCALILLVPDSHSPHHEPYTIVDQSVRTAASLPNLAQAKGLVNAVLRRFLREQTDLLHAAKQEPEAFWNYPVWWINRIQEVYPDNWKNILSVGNTPPPLTLRINRKKTTVAAYIEYVKSTQLDAVAIGPYAVKLVNPVPVDLIPGFKEGLVSVQDSAAQQAAPLLDLDDGMNVLDACAAPGGKSGHMLETANIDLLALDSDLPRLKMIYANLDRLHLKAKTKKGDATRQDWWDKTPFDRILADVPCTASGIIRRHPDIRWLRRPQDSKSLSTLSMQILKNLWSMLKPGGKLLLVTCSIWPEESEWQANAFASWSGAKRLDAPGQLLPTAEKIIDHDGLFYALFKKNNTLSY